MAEQYYATISDLIRSIDHEEISYRNLHTTFCIRENGTDTIQVPYKSIIREYIDLMNEDAVSVKLPDDEVRIYQYKPKKLSLDLYGTTELWAGLLELNHMYSILNFDCMKPFLVFNPGTVRKKINEILIAEEVIK